MTNELQYWFSMFVNVIALPVLGYIFWQFSKQADRTEKVDARLTLLSEAFSSYKEVVAYTFATLVRVKDIEDRIDRKLDRIDGKLDVLNERNRRRDGD